MPILVAALWPLLGQRWWWWIPGRVWIVRRRRARGHRFRAMCRDSLLRFGLTAIVALALLGRSGALVAMPPEFWGAANALGGGAPDRWLVGALVLGAALGLATGAFATAWWAWRGWQVRRPFGDFEGLEAGRAGDRGWGIALSLVAGVTEEGYFRVALPLLGTLAGLGAGAAFVGAGLFFGLAHRYQGWRGVAATTVAGAGFAALYLSTASLPLAMAAHALVDINSLVLRPWVRDAVLRRVDARRPARAR